MRTAQLPIVIRIGVTTDLDGEKCRQIVEKLKGWRLAAWVYQEKGYGIAIETLVDLATNAIGLFQEAAKNIN